MLKVQKEGAQECFGDADRGSIALASGGAGSWVSGVGRKGPGAGVCAAADFTPLPAWSPQTLPAGGPCVHGWEWVRGHEPV